MLQDRRDLEAGRVHGAVDADHLLRVFFCKHLQKPAQGKLTRSHLCLRIHRCDAHSESFLRADTKPVKRSTPYGVGHWPFFQFP